MVVIFSELTNSRETKPPSGIFLFLFPWMSAILVSLPVYWTYNYIQEQHGFQKSGACARVVLMGSSIAYYGYESISVFLRFLAPTTYMIYAMQRIGFRIKFLFIFKPIPANIPLNLIRRVRFVFCHMIFFILTWVPVGAFNLNHVLTSLPSACPVVEKPDKIVGVSFSIVFLLQTISQPFLYFITVYDTPLCDYLQNIMSVLISEEIGAVGGD
ncbi:uncharacterized protein LOC118433322 [Folsomia candida]|uniref:uncharacterized protein LOC118433322 n=1 Tax=Folsomia candida TaxID=158441 RepID=UPI001604E960|nr:uncharacterized protein LOC118433322 [Folsomia candida]